MERIRCQRFTLSHAPRRLSPSIAAGLLGAGAFLVYLSTLAPSIVWGDSPELTSAAYHLGVAHPSGYPLYTLVGHLVTRLLPFGSPAYRMNLLSAAAAALAVALVYLLALRITRRPLAAAVTALLLAFSRTFWSQAVIAEVYALHLLLTSATLLCVVTWDARGDRRWLRAGAALYGLCFTHHLTSFLLAPGLLYFAVTSRHRGQLLAEMRWLVPLFLAPLLLYGYLPLAALRDTPANWNDPRSWENFVRHASGAEYRDMLGQPSLAAFWTSFLKYAGAGGRLWAQVPAPILALAPVGLYALFRRRRRLLGLTALVYAATVLYAVNYRIHDVEVYYLVPHLVVALWIGCGVRAAGGWLACALRFRHPSPTPEPPRPPDSGGRVRRPGLGAARVVYGTMLIIPLVALAANWEVNDRSGDWSALRYARTAVAALKPGAVVFAAGERACFPLLYALHVEGRRPDVTLVPFTDLYYPHRLRLTTRLAARGLVVNVPECYRRGAGELHTDPCLLRQVVADNIGRRPVYVQMDPARLALTGWLDELSREYYRSARSNFYTHELTRERPSLEATSRPKRAAEIRFGRREADGSFRAALELAGCDAEPVRRGDVSWIRLRYHWRRLPGAALRRPRVEALFTDAEGNFRTDLPGPPARNDHALGIAAGPQVSELPAAFCETFDVLLPEGKPQHLWLAVRDDDGYLASPGTTGCYVEVGEVPATGPVLAKRR